jgi:hypothetical protein
MGARSVLRSLNWPAAGIALQLADMAMGLQFGRVVPAFLLVSSTPILLWLGETVDRSLSSGRETSTLDRLRVGFAILGALLPGAAVILEAARGPAVWAATGTITIVGVLVCVVAMPAPRSSLDVDPRAASTPSDVLVWLAMACAAARVLFSIPSTARVSVGVASSLLLLLALGARRRRNAAA